MEKPGYGKASLLAFLLSVVLLGDATFAEAESTNYTTINTPRFILYIGENPAANNERKPSEQDIAQTAISILDSTYEEIARIFQTRPEKKVILRFLSPTEFRFQTGAPEWTSAMYLRDEITIPVNARTLGNRLELQRALRHEYVHAVVAQLSDYRCPAWMDEGLAQLIEGRPNPLLGPALRQWIADNPAMPFDWLRNGFTTMENRFVPAAYAQSLFAVRRLIHQAGFPAAVNYLRYLRENKSEYEAFELAFARSLPRFEKELDRQIKRWANSDQVDP